MKTHWAESWGRPALRILVPLTAAMLLIGLEPAFTALAQSRPGVLPVAMVAVLGGLLIARVRRYLIVTLCFGIGLLAATDALRNVPPPPVIDYTFVETLYPFGWMLLALLAFGAGAAEAIHPESVTARRFYFGAAALYFLGHGVLSLLRVVTWEAVALVIVGIVALAGVAMAHRIVKAEEEQAEDADIRALAERAARRADQLASREWRESTPEEMKRARQH